MNNNNKKERQPETEPTLIENQQNFNNYNMNNANHNPRANYES